MGVPVGEAPNLRERWLVPPRLLTTTGADRDRRASWLELFFDLVFVVAILDTPWRYVVWVVAQVLELSLPPLSTRLHRRIPTSPYHLPERWALFTLIVLGESVVAVAVEMSDSDWHFSSAATAVVGFAAVATVWAAPCCSFSRSSARARWWSEAPIDSACR